MRDLGGDGATGGSSAVVLPTPGEVLELAARLAGPGSGLDDAGRIDLIAALETLKRAAEAAQAEATADFDRSQRAAAAARGVPAERQARGIPEQIALARRESPHRARRHVGLARILRTELPRTRAAFLAGRVSEWQVTVLARETACLSLADRKAVDEALASEPDRLATLSGRAIVGEVLKLAAGLDAASVAERRRRAEADRHTSLRPAPDVMTWFTALLPVRCGVAVHKALLEEAARVKSTGDARSRGAIMADVLVARILAPRTPASAAKAASTNAAGPAGPDATGPAGAPVVPLVINVSVPDTVLLGDEHGAGSVEGYGPVPGDLLREWIADHLERGVADQVRRLYRRPASGELVAMDQKSDFFDGRLADFLRLRDQRCRTPGCDAPIRHLDHAVDRAQGGATSAANGQGLCESCNYAKQAEGWRVRPVPGQVHAIEITTPTGHKYRSAAPAHAPPIR